MLELWQAARHDVARAVDMSVDDAPDLSVALVRMTTATLSASARAAKTCPESLFLHPPNAGGRG